MSQFEREIQIFRILSIGVTEKVLNFSIAEILNFSGISCKSTDFWSAYFSGHPVRNITDLNTNVTVYKNSNDGLILCATEKFCRADRTVFGAMREVFRKSCRRCAFQVDRC